MRIELPDTNGMSVFDAAQAFASSGIPVVPFDPKAGKGKNCGNLLGDSRYRGPVGLPDGLRWYDYATTNAETLERWNEVRPFEAIATSPGRFGAIVLDIDTPELFPAEFRPACKNAPHVITRSKRRGHYWFSQPNTPAPAMIGNRSFPWGEVRAMGGGIVLPPYPNDSRRIAKAGKLTDLPTELMNLVAGAGWIASRVDLDAFCAANTGNKYPGKLKGLIGLHTYQMSKTNAHEAMLEALRVGFEEAVAGFIPAKAVLDAMRERWDRDPREFRRLAVWCASVAENSDRAEVEARSRRLGGTDSRQYAARLSSRQ